MAVSSAGLERRGTPRTLARAALAAPRGPRTTRAAQRRTWVVAYAFIAPALVLTVLFSLVPLGMLVYRSLFVGNVFATNLHFAGLANYVATLTQGGGHALAVTAEYTVAFVVLSMGIGLSIALLLNIRLPGLSRVRAAFIVPLVVPVVATALIWGNLFAPQFGLVNRLLISLGIPQVNWLSSPAPALATVVLFGTWQFFGENVILYLAALKALPMDLLEAASVDGASTWQRFRYIRRPLLRRSTTLIWVVTTLTGLQTFTQIFILTSGGPNGATQTALYYLYQQAFVQSNAGQADAMGFVLFLLSLLVTVVQVAVVGRDARSDA